MLRNAAPSGSDSVFRLPITNALALDKKGAYTRLKILALQQPGKYAEDRQILFETIVTKLVEAEYNIIWSVLADGKIGKDNDIMICGRHFNPHLPALEIAEISSNMAKTVMTAWEKIFEKILPDSFSSVANSKLEKSTTIQMNDDLSDEVSGSDEVYNVE